MGEPLIIKLAIDQIEAVRVHFFPYMEMLCETKIKDVQHDANEQLSFKAARSLFLTVVEKFDRKALLHSKRPTVKFNFAEALVFYRLLLDLPIRSTEIWLLNLRTHLVTMLHQQMCEP